MNISPVEFMFHRNSVPKVRHSLIFFRKPTVQSLIVEWGGGVGEKAMGIWFVNRKVQQNWTDKSGVRVTQLISARCGFQERVGCRRSVQGKRAGRAARCQPVQRPAVPVARAVRCLATLRVAARRQALLLQLQVPQAPFSLPPIGCSLSSWWGKTPKGNSLISLSAHTHTLPLSLLLPPPLWAKRDSLKSQMRQFTTTLKSTDLKQLFRPPVYHHFKVLPIWTNYSDRQFTTLSLTDLNQLFRPSVYHFKVLPIWTNYSDRRFTTLKSYGRSEPIIQTVGLPL